MHIEKEILTLRDDILVVDDWQADYDVFAGFSTRNGGESDVPFNTMNLSYIVGDDDATVLENRKILAGKTPVPYENWIFAEQKHTNNIKQVTKADCGRGALDFASGIPNTDGLYTDERDVMLATFHADCTPVYFYAPKQHLIGLVHAGWQGTVKEITRDFLKVWFKLGVKAKDIQIVIGPSASQAAYIVGEDVVQEVLKMKLEDARDGLIDLGNGKFKLDTAYLNYLEAIELGVPEENIVISSYCTISDADLFFSYRRDRETGRMLAFISQK